MTAGRRRRARPDRRPGLRVLFVGINPSLCSARGRAPLRAARQPLLAGAARRRVHAAPAAPRRGRRAARARDRRHEHRRPSDARRRGDHAPRSCARAPARSSRLVRRDAPRLVAVVGLTAYRTAFGATAARRSACSPTRSAAGRCGCCRIPAASTRTTSPRTSRRLYAEARAYAETLDSGATEFGSRTPHARALPCPHVALRDRRRARAAQRDGRPRRDRALPRPLQRPRARAAQRAGRRARPARPFPQIEDALGWPHRRIASVLGGVAHLRQTEFAGRRPYRFHDERRSASGRWELWMDSTQARAVRAAAARRRRSRRRACAPRVAAAAQAGTPRRHPGHPAGLRFHPTKEEARVDT